MTAPEVLSIGRVSVDLYASAPGIGFEVEQTFVKSVGGSPTNVAVAAARLGRRSAVATKVGGDGLGRYVRARLADWGVSLDHVGVDADGQTALALVALDPPESPQIAFYRGSAAPDTTLVETDVPEMVVRSCGVLWVSHAALAQGSTATAALAWLRTRDRAGHTVLDLDYRPALWPDQATARRTTARAIDLATVVVGNLEECEMAVGTRDPGAAADALLAAGVELAVVKLGADGVLLAGPYGRWSVPATPVDVVCGLGAGDAFGGVLCHGLLAGWDTERIGRAAARAGALVAGRLTCSHDMPTLAELEPLPAAGGGA